MPKQAPDLRFGPGPSQGFTPAGISAFDDLLPAAVVRELIQNALDAARDAKINPTIVRFRLTEATRNSIPGIESYENAFNKAKTFNLQRGMAGGEIAGPAKLVVDRIDKALGKTNFDVLTVLDNGIGLDSGRMDGLLSDGLSRKTPGAAGTYGNGHATAIPASDLRYVLYGGITKNGNRIGAGHAVLASHIKKGENHLCSGDGFYINDFRIEEESIYDYATGNQVPDFIAEPLEDIRRNTTHGTAVIITAFNNFVEQEDLWTMVSMAASASFFVAIEDGSLEVHVEDRRTRGHDDIMILNKSTLAKVLEAHQKNKRAKKFLSGQRAFEAYWTYKTGNRHKINTSAGTVEIRIGKSSSDNSRIHLCRNGMWITNNPPSFQQKFTEKVPFRAVLLLKEKKGRDLYKFIQRAEGPLHDKIEMKHLAPSDRDACYKALREIVEWIRKNTDTVKTDTYNVPDYLTLDFGDAHGAGAGKASTGMWGVPVAVGRRIPYQRPPAPRPDPEPNPGPLPRKTDEPGQKTRPVLPKFFQAVSRPAGNGRRRIVIECNKDYTNAELRLVVDEALDATCDRHGQDQYAPAVLGNVKIDGKKVKETDLVHWNKDVVGIRLGDLKENSLLEIETDYRLTGDFVNLPQPSLRVEVSKSDK